MVSSGLPTDKYIFLGFLPKKEGNRLKLLTNLKAANEKLEATVIIYEAPHRIVKTLSSVKQIFGNIKVSLARELTKIHEEVASGNIEDFVTKYKTQNPKGEFVILFSTKPEKLIA